MAGRQVVEGEPTVSPGRFSEPPWNKDHGASEGLAGCLREHVSGEADNALGGELEYLDAEPLYQRARRKQCKELFSALVHRDTLSQ